MTITVRNTALSLNIKVNFQKQFAHNLPLLQLTVTMNFLAVLAIRLVDFLPIEILSW